MRNVQAARYKARLDHLFEKVGAMTDDLELQAHWARYLCVLVSGFLEIAISAIYSQYARDTAAPNVANYVAQELDFFINPNMTKITRLTRSFNQQWGAALEQQTEGETKNAIDSIYGNRNQIAHGKDTGISYAYIYRWYREAIRVVELIEERCQRG